MKLSKRGEYALRLLIDLGIAPHAGRDMLQLKEIAHHERIPHRFLEQIVIPLREAGYIATKRGKHGGYFLNTPPTSISMGQVVRLLDGPLAPIGCVSQMRYEKCTCPDEAHCGLRMLMLDVRNAIADILDRYSLGQVIEVTLRKLKQDRLPIPFSLDSRSNQSGKQSLQSLGLIDFEI